MKNAMLVKQYLWLINLIMISVFVFIASDIFITFMNSYLDMPYETASSKGIDKKDVSKKRTLTYYSVIEKRNIFNSSPIKKAEPEPNWDDLFAKELSAIPTSLSVRLLGTIVWDVEKTRAVIENLRTRKQDIYKVGDMIEGAEIIDITRNKVLLMNRDHVETLLAFDSSKKDNNKIVTPAGLPFGNRNSNIRNVGRNKYVIPKSEVDSVMNNMSSLITQARLRPHFENGKPSGFRIDKIKQNSLVSKIGIKNGDIIQSVNGIDVDSPEKAFTMYNQLRSEKNIKLRVKRNRRVEEYYYSIK